MYGRINLPFAGVALRLMVRTPVLGPGTVIQDVDAAPRRRKPALLPAVSVDFNPRYSSLLLNAAVKMQSLVVGRPMQRA